VKASTSPKRSSRFTPILIVGHASPEREALQVRLARSFESTDAIEFSQLVDHLAAPVTLGAVLLLPDTDLTQAGSPITAVRQADRSLPVLIVGDRLTPAQVADVLRAGATDVLFGEQLAAGLELLEPLVERRRRRSHGQLFQDLPGMPRVIGTTNVMRDLVTLVERVAVSDATVLILGESGTGKELIARAIHALSPRSKGPFIAINCAAIPETLLENELFGHEKGAFTGAVSLALGKVDAAEKGTLFLDEIGEMPLTLQSKILRLLQDRTYDRVGGSKTRKADVRIVTATNRDLKDEVAAKRFREDLYYRLSVVPLTLPALRDRREDIPLIAQAILEKLSRQLGRPGLRLSPEALVRMVHYRWPGNVRELENELERASVLVRGDLIEPTDLELRSRVEDPERQAWSHLVDLSAPLQRTLERAREAVTRLRIAVALEDCAGDRDAAAAQLAISRHELDQQLDDVVPS
jgi:DNA-binding NtrC family response regulator